MPVPIALLHHCARPPFALDRLRELDPESLLYESTEAGPGGNGPLLLTPRELLDRLAALVPPPSTHRSRYFATSVCSREWRLARIFRGDAERQELAGYCRSRRRLIAQRRDQFLGLPDQ